MSEKGNTSRVDDTLVSIYFGKKGDKDQGPAM